MGVNLKLILFFLGCGVVDSYKILVVFPVAAKSHWILGNSLARGLVNGGHDVTYVSPFPDKNPPGNYTDVVLTDLHLLVQQNFDFFEMERMNPFLFIYLLDQLGEILTEAAFKHENFQKLIKSNQDFDLIIIEQFCNDALKVLSWHYKAPLIIFSTLGANYMVNNLVGNPAPPSYVPDVFLNLHTHMNFFQRLYNSAILLSRELNHPNIVKGQNLLMKKYFPDSPDLSTIMNNVSLVLLNSHESSNYPVPVVPNMINIGGFHIQPPKKLPADLKSILDKAKDGVVYFSLGSNLSPAMLPLDVKSALFEALGKLKQTVIVKWDEDVPETPKNVIIKQWCPQQDILAHPNVVLFITHGGLLSTLETIYHGVPVLTLPFFGDQKMNALKAVQAGIGLTISFSEISEKTLTANINELLDNPKYTLNVKTRSSLMRDRPVKPIDLAVYWSEFVIRTKGAPHLKVDGLNLKWYQYLLLDIICFIVVVLFSVCFVFLYVIKKIFFAKETKVKFEKIKKN